MNRVDRQKVAVELVAVARELLNSNRNYQKDIDLSSALLTAKIIFNETGRQDLAERLDVIKEDFLDSQ